MAEEVRAWASENGVTVCTPGHQVPRVCASSWSSISIDEDKRRAEILLDERLPCLYLSWEEGYGSGHEDGGLFLWMNEEANKDACLQEWLASVMEYAAEGSRIPAVLAKGLRMWKKVAEKLNSKGMEDAASDFEEMEDGDDEEHVYEQEAFCHSVCREAPDASSGQRASETSEGQADATCGLKRKRNEERLTPVTPVPREGLTARQSGHATNDVATPTNDVATPTNDVAIPRLELEQHEDEQHEELRGYHAGSNAGKDETEGGHRHSESDGAGENEAEGVQAKAEVKQVVEAKGKRKGKAKKEQQRAPPTMEANVALSRNFRDLQKCCKEVCAELSLVDESDLYLWEVRLSGFPSDSTLSADLAKTPGGAVVLQLSFSGAFPYEPPFVRVLRPRFKPHSGHVSNGGSVCLEVLTLSGWTPATSIESLLVAIRAGMVEANGRVDFKSGLDYRLDRAIAGYRQLARGHRWQPIPL